VTESAWRFTILGYPVGLGAPGWLLLGVAAVLVAAVAAFAALRRRAAVRRLLGARLGDSLAPGVSSTPLVVRALSTGVSLLLFAVALADAVGPTGAVLAIESDARAIADAKSNLRLRPEIELRRGKVDRVLKPLVRQGIRTDLVVLDPPRAGAGKSVIKDIAALAPRVIAYVACDPAALARDVAYARDADYVIRSLRAFDAFPMTCHVECIAILEPLA